MIAIFGFLITFLNISGNWSNKTKFQEGGQT